MPGVIVNMENGEASGPRTDHDRNQVNGVHGSDNDAGAEQAAKGKANAEISQRQMHTELPLRMNDLPDEIVHITQGFVPLSLLLTRLAQRTHNALQEKVAELAKMPLPGAVVNGNASHSASGPDDASAENLRKKATLLHFAQDMHAKWVKALVVTEWSRKSEMVSKLIDLKFHIDQQRILYDGSLDSMVNVKRDLTFARMPSPDLKTALQILSTGSAPWIPDHGYIEPPALTASEQLKWMNDLNTLLSLRLNMDDYDKIPHHFKQYKIESGRVTFTVAGEFEVELTIADEDFEKQFWFIDFRYAFTPSAASLPDSMRTYLEACVNDMLSKDGLTGCYQFLHEFVLTSKINELRRQAFQLSKTSWNGTIVVEPLNRAIAIQYWSSRSSTTGLKSWILVAISSGKKNGKQDSRSSSHLVARWYRDNKEVKDVELAWDTKNLSAESLLRDVVGRHVEYILKSIQNKLQSAPRFQRREAAMMLHIAKNDPGASYLSTQVGCNDKTSLLVEPTTGVFAVKPQTKFSIQYEHQLNSGKQAAEDGVTCLESVRCAVFEDELNRRGSAAGWQTQKSPLTLEETRQVTKLREWTRSIWLQKDGWTDGWYVVVFLGLGGDEWWLLEAHRGDNKANRFQARLPLSKGQPDLLDAFWSNLTLFATGMIAQAVDMRELHRHRIKSRSNDCANLGLPQQVRLPAIEVDLSVMFPHMVFETAPKPKHDAGGAAKDAEVLALMHPHTGGPQGPRQPWANNIVTIRFKGVQSQFNDGEYRLVCVSEALLKVRRQAKFTTLKGSVDRNLSYNGKKGEFSLRMEHAVGEPVLAVLKSRIMAIDRFVNFLEAIEKYKAFITPESVTLKQVTFFYQDKHAEPKDGSEAIRWKVMLDLSKDEIDIDIEKGNPHLRVVDLMKRLVNSEGGIPALTGWLPASLQALEAINKMETRWEDAQSKRTGQIEFAMKTLSWLSIRYWMHNPTPTKEVVLEVRTKIRRGEAWWHVWRSDAGASTTLEDEFTTALKTIWNGKGDGWLGLTTGAAARSDSGIVDMLLAVDEAIRTAGNGASTSTQSASAAPPVAQNNAHDVVVLD